jgi:hypothetical protein
MAAATALPSPPVFSSYYQNGVLWTSMVPVPAAAFVEESKQQQQKPSDSSTG